MNFIIYNNHINAIECSTNTKKIMKYLIIIILFAFGCSSTKMINTKKGRIHKYQKEYIETFVFHDDIRMITHLNERGQVDAFLDASDIRALKIDSLTTKFIEYNAER